MKIVDQNRSTNISLLLRGLCKKEEVLRRWKLEHDFKREKTLRSKVLNRYTSLYVYIY